MAVAARSRDLPDLIQAQYPSLLRLAQRVYQGEAHNSVSPASLVHEAFVRLCDQPKVAAGGEVFFRACFAQECRRILVDHARRRRALKRGGGAAIETLAEQGELGLSGQMDLVHVNEAIEGLAKRNARMARIVDLRIFGGLTVPECAGALGVSPRTVDSEWAFARAWLQKQLG